MWIDRKGITLGLALYLTACTTPSPREEIFRKDAVPMREIYHQAATLGAYRHLGRVTVSDRIGPERDARAGWTREPASEIRNRFPQGPNPSLLMYVFPHITPDGTPIPGFTTPFKLYEVDYYVLPGEVNP